jgi:adenylate cyclase
LTRPGAGLSLNPGAPPLTDASAGGEAPRSPADPEGQLVVRVYQNDTLLFSTEVVGSVEVGRQRAGERGALLKYSPGPDGASRIVIAGVDDLKVSRRHALLEPLPGERVRVSNISAGSTVSLGDGSVLRPGASRDTALPCRLALGGRQVAIDGPEPYPGVLERLEPQPASRVAADLDGSTIRRLAVASGRVVDTEAILRWLKTSVIVIQNAASSEDFLHQVARAVVEVGLDNGAVLMRGEGGWVARSFFSGTPGAAGNEWRPSTRILSAVSEQKRTVWQKPKLGAEDSTSLKDVDTVVASPILDRTGEVTGIVYGDRRVGALVETTVASLKAMLVELLACGVAAGLARVEQERAAIAARVRFEEFFTPELSRELEAQPDLLQGKDVEVTILVVDVRGFSRISERLGPAKTVGWIRDMMAVLSDCVLAENGVVVDYVGDEILAMWGAPKEQPDHPAHACRAGLAMLQVLPRLNDLWRSFLGEPVEIGIGINTGMARVGNVGSDRKFKYGPLGTTVNVASRVQGTTKYLKSRIVVTGATRARLGPEFQCRRLCRARVMNIAEPVELHELAAAGEAEFASVHDAYEAALDAFERGHFQEAARRLGEVIVQRSTDGPALLLMSRVVECLNQSPGAFDPVWTLPGK